MITLEWGGEPQLDATLVASGVYIGWSQQAGVERALLEASVQKYESYELRISSY